MVMSKKGEKKFLFPLLNLHAGLYMYIDGLPRGLSRPVLCVALANRLQLCFFACTRSTVLVSVYVIDIILLWLL